MSSNDAQLQRVIKSLLLMAGLSYGMLIGVVAGALLWVVPAVQPAFPAVVLGTTLLGGTIGTLVALIKMPKRIVLD